VEGSRDELRLSYTGKKRAMDHLTSLLLRRNRNDIKGPP
jgi:hypothetical protein